jgi:asparagine synthase (glutamine-hydrolysing)
MEVRVPFLDHRLVELALGIPDKIKYPNHPKQLLTEALGDLLPEEITRRTKQGFVLPWDSWMRGDLAPLIESGLGHLKSVEGVKAAGIDRLYNQFKGGNPRIHWTHIWALVTLGHWTHRHGIKG